MKAGTIEVGAWVQLKRSTDCYPSRESSYAARVLVRILSSEMPERLRLQITEKHLKDWCIGADLNVPHFHVACLNFLHSMFRPCVDPR